MKLESLPWNVHPQFHKANTYTYALSFGAADVTEETYG